MLNYELVWSAISSNKGQIKWNLLMLGRISSTMIYYLVLNCNEFINRHSWRNKGVEFVICGISKCDSDDERVFFRNRENTMENFTVINSSSCWNGIKSLSLCGKHDSLVESTNIENRIFGMPHQQLVHRKEPFGMIRTLECLLQAEKIIFPCTEHSPLKHRSCAVVEHPFLVQPLIHSSGHIRNGLC